MIEREQAKAAEHSSAKEPAANAPESRKEESEECTVITDRVDREIERLKKKVQEYEKQLRAADDPQKAAALEKKLAQAEEELLAKDNDAYRKQNADVSGG